MHSAVGQAICILPFGPAHSSELDRMPNYIDKGEWKQVAPGAAVATTQLRPLTL